MAEVRGRALWACLHEPNRRYDPVYCIDLVLDAEEQDKVLEEYKRHDKGSKPPFITSREGETVLKLKTKYINKKTGEPNPPIPVVDIHGEPMTALVGNGSMVEVLYHFKRWENNKGTGIGKYPIKVRVLELIEYIPTEFSTESDYVAPNTEGTPPIEDEDKF